MNFEMVDFRLMVRIAEQNSLTRGAEAAHLSLPAASLRIKALEEAIGTKLLHRTHKGVTLTPSGQAFVQHARQVLGQVEHLRGDLQEYARGV
ncbi:MAG: LysR family transcriptional regulator, partial [Burkholderiaceae bacterium]